MLLLVNAGFCLFHTTLLEAAAVLVEFVHSNHILIGIYLLAAYLQRQIVWV
ncbi:RNA polymerase subunit sigma-70 [Vibrio cholerae]|nr:RNA polymerase subunit sigma-70 [Vibrio cholerae]